MRPYAHGNASEFIFGPHTHTRTHSYKKFAAIFEFFAIFYSNPFSWNGTMSKKMTENNPTYVLEISSDTINGRQKLQPFHDLFMFPSSPSTLCPAPTRNKNRKTTKFFSKTKFTNIEQTKPTKKNKPKHYKTNKIKQKQNKKT